MLRIVDATPATAGKLCRGYSENAGDNASCDSIPRIFA
jgi:hypothetical protein